MAFGKPTDVKRVKNAVLEGQLVKTYVKTEERSRQNWKKKWNWLLNEYVDLHNKVSELSKDSKFLSDVNKGQREKDTRTINPIPPTKNHEYGWIASLPDFKLEKYGPDYEAGMALPEQYHIFKAHLKYE